MRLPVDIRERRKELGLTQRELAEQSGVCKQRISAVENDSKLLSANVAMALSVPLKTPWFLFFDYHESLKFLEDMR